MTTLRVAATSLNLTALDFEGNKKIIIAAIDDAKKQGVSLLCLPELSITGYGCEDAFLFPHVRQNALKVLEELKPITKNIAVTVGLPIEHNQKIYNGAAMLVDGEIVGIVFKQHLAGDGIHYEPRWFTPWKRGETASLVIGSASVMIGDLAFALNKSIKIGFEICEDAWVDDRPAKHLAGCSVDIILNPSASHFALGKYKTRTELVRKGSEIISGAYIYANHLGNEAGRAIYDGDTIIAQNGKIISTGERFSFHDRVMTVTDIEVKSKIRSSKYSKEVSVMLPLPVKNSLLPTTKINLWESSSELKFEEFTRAVSLGLFDYLRKSRANGFVVSLSGGADSASVALLVYCMSILAGKNVPMQELLHCVYQPTKNSSKVTLHAAQTIASRIGAEFSTLNVDSLVDEYIKGAEQIVGRTLNWNDDDITLQNIQARVRSPGVWMIANVKKALLLTTSNRSEGSVGYATMDGDTSGCLAPIAGIDKFFLLQWLSWMEKIGIAETGAILELSVITAQAPTAELRPAEAQQTDEKDLMPYEVLAVLERTILFERNSPEIALEKLLTQFSQKYKKEDLQKYMEKFLNLWRTSQWKRERIAPGFHLDDYSIDPKTWLRFPILNGGL